MNTETEQKIAHWRHSDGREVLVFPTHKVRYIPGRSCDEWRTLQRATVPNLTDAEWIAAPNSEWTAVQPRPEFPEGIHPDLIACLRSHGVTPESVSLRYSDVYVECPDYTIAHAIRDGGIWRSMATVFKSNITNGPCVEIPFAALSAEISKRAK